MKQLKWLVVPAALLAAPAALADLELPRTAETLRIDGHLSDAAWTGALRVDRFYEVLPGDNAEPQVRTEGWLLLGADALYVAIRAADPAPAQIRAPWIARDRVLADQDFVQIAIDAQDDGKSATVFRVNPRGIQTDGVYTESEGREDFAPDFAFDSAARIHAAGWDVEMRIPLAALRFPRTEPQTWRIVFERIHPRTHRYYYVSSPRPRGSGCNLCNVLRVGGIRGLARSGSLTVAPYATTRAVDDLRGEPRTTASDAGADVKWLPSPGLSLDVTLRPDFSHVESDAAQISVNTRFALFQTEKRPFFMEGADLLSSPIPAIHTRTITSPLWGARLTGRPGNHAFTLVVADDRGGGSVIVPGPANSRLAPQSDASLSLLGRYRHAFGRSSGGLLLTARHGHATSNTVLGPDVLWWPRERDAVRAQVLFSETRDGGERRGGHTAFLQWSHNGRRVQSGLTLRELSHGFRADSGFVPQTGIRAAAMRVSGTWYPRRWVSRVIPSIEGERVVERGAALVSQNVFVRLYAEGWRGTVAIVEHHPADKGRAFDGSVHDQAYTLATLRFLLSRRVPYLRFVVRRGEELEIERAQVGDSTVVNLLASLQPVDHMQIELSGERQVLHLDGRRLFAASTMRVNTTWTFSQRAFVRAVADHQRVTWDPSRAPAASRRSGRADTSLLFGYRLTPQTSVYAGYGDGRSMDPAGRFAAPRREVFVKVSYGW
ncbi:MAG TPA: DUF5916 domain-containing protein, partial [Thermoanaerobaculia bacterium]|nr:DUF5916 domain-containing protein [Thermoanaerobaculia bacterium]